MERRKRPLGRRHIDGGAVPFSGHWGDICSSPDPMAYESSGRDSCILTGITEISDASEPIYGCPFTSQGDLADVDYEELFASVIQTVLEGQECDLSAGDVRGMCAVVAARDSCVRSHEFVCRKLLEFADAIPGELAGMGSADALGELWSSIAARVNFVTTAFSPLCMGNRGLCDFERLFRDRMTENWRKDPGMFGRITKVILDAYNGYRESGDIEMVRGAFKFARESGVFHELFVKKFTKAVVRYLTPVLDELFKRKLSEYLASAVELDTRERRLAEPLVDSFAMSALQVAMNNLVFTCKLDHICKGLKVLIDECDVKSVDLCAKYARATDKIKEFTRELSFEIELSTESCFKKEHPMQEVIKVHDAVIKFCSVSFSTQHSRILRTAFEKGLNTSPTVAARLLAEEIHARFVSDEQVSTEELEQFISVFRFLSEKDVFEAYHHMLLCRRVLLMKNHIVHSDEVFLAELREQCGPDYTKRFDTIFKDVQNSMEAVKAFRQEQHPSKFFNALVLSNEAWQKLNHTSIKAVLPPEIESMLTRFSVFYIERNKKRKLQWQPTFTRVKLQVKNVPNVQEIRCNGLYAIILLLFNSLDLVDAVDLETRLDLPKEQVAKLLHILESKKFGHLINYMNNWVSINRQNTVTDGVISLPFPFPTLPKYEDSAQSSIQQNRACQVDAAVMLVMKKERSMEKGDLKSKVKELLTFRLEDELYESRLAHLEKIMYLKLDPSGHVHYLP